MTSVTVNVKGGPSLTLTLAIPRRYRDLLGFTEPNLRLVSARG